MREVDKIKVRDVMRDKVTMVDGSIDVLEAMRIMKSAGTTSLIVAKQVIAKDRAPERVNAFEIMAKPVVSVRPDMSIRFCARLFENFGMSHAPVIEHENVVGIVSYYTLVLGAIDLSDDKP